MLSFFGADVLDKGQFRSGRDEFIFFIIIHTQLFPFEFGNAFSR
jgi:hypothetical protein